MQFVVTAMDYTDDDALNRRMNNRDSHLKSINKLIADKHFVSGGALLDDAGKMIGSSLHLEFPDRQSLEAHLQQDPYVAGKVWEKIKIREARLVPVNKD